MIRLSTSLLAACLMLAVPAWADDDCAVPMADWQPRDAVATFAVAQGWTVKRIRLDDGCYEVDATDASGQRIEVKLNPATLAIEEYEVEADRDHRDDHDDRDGDDRGED